MSSRCWHGPLELEAAGITVAVSTRAVQKMPGKKNKVGKGALKTADYFSCKSRKREGCF